MQIPEKTKMLALAYLKNGMRPKQVADAIEGLSYSQALNLRKELELAEEQNTLTELFSLDKAALETLLESVKSRVTEDAGDLVEGELIEASIDKIASQVHGIQKLEESLNKAAIIMSQQIQAKAILANSPDSLLVLAEALAKLQLAFFAKGTNVQVNNIQNFEQFLKD